MCSHVENVVLIIQTAYYFAPNAEQSWSNQRNRTAKLSVLKLQTTFYTNRAGEQPALVKVTGCSYTFEATASRSSLS